jgi:hypothetical protein
MRDINAGYERRPAMPARVPDLLSAVEIMCNGFRDEI